jgi:hypothetical protein
MKTCTSCHQEKPDTEFNFKFKALGIRSETCRECKKKFQHEWYINHLEQEKDRTRRNRMRMTDSAREFVYSYLAEHPCVDCGEDDPRVLDFDHVRGKARTVSLLVAGGASVERIKIEIGLCVVRCANCHRKKTSNDFNWRRGRR